MSETVHVIAERLVHRYGTRDPFDIADCLGVEIMRSDKLCKLNGMYLYILRNPFIVINSNLSDHIQRIICAHELGHDRLHRNLAALGAIQETLLLDMTTKPEFEANIFAAELLLSDNDILSLRDSGFDAFQMASELETDVNLVLLKTSQMKKRGYPFDIDTSLYDRKFIT